MVHFFKTFLTDSKSAWNSPFFYTHIQFFNKKIVLLLLALFVNFDCKCAGNGLKKRKIFFYECVLQFYVLGNHQRVCISKLLKSLYPSLIHIPIHLYAYIYILHMNPGSLASLPSPINTTLYYLLLFIILMKFNWKVWAQWWNEQRVIHN
jgi:hypothetical protein